MRYIKFSMQIALIGRLLTQQLITDGEYYLLLKRTMQEYDIKCWDV